jgi:pimeloyl-ACP methyl ester carboxylesterase
VSQNCAKQRNKGEAHVGKSTAIDGKTGRKFYLDDADGLKVGDAFTFILNLHGGGSVGAWQRAYFPASDYADKHRLIVATPSCATKEPMRHWVGEADDQHLRNIVDEVLDTYGRENIARFWLAGHSQGGMTSNRLLKDRYWQDRVDGWLSLSGGRIGPIELPPEFFVPVRGPQGPPSAPRGDGPRPGRAVEVDCDISFIFATGEHEMVALPETSPWAEKYGAGPRRRLADVIDDQPGQIHDTSREGRSNAAWGLSARPGVAEVYIYPDARGGRVIADVVRRDKGHTEGLEPRVTETLIEMMVAAPGGKVRGLA